MAEVHDLARIQQAHHAQLLAIRSSTAGLVEDAWDAYAGLDTASAKRFTEAAGAIVDGAKMQTAASAAAYLEANDRVLGHLSEITPSLPVIRNGIPTSQVYERSIVQARTMVSNGSSVDRAMNAGQNRAASTARTDVIAANRTAIGDSRRTWVVGYRRVLTGKSCALCATASTQRYHVADLQPIHASCDCDIAEIYGEADPGRIVNHDLLQEIKDATAGGNNGVNYWDRPRYLVGDDGAFYQAKVVYSKDPTTGKRLLTKNGSPVRKIEAGDVVKPATKTHGELGETLVDSRHAFTSADEIADLELPDPPPSPATVVDEVVAQVDDVPVPEAPGPRLKPTDPQDPRVVREASRRNVSREVVAQEHDAKKLSKAQDARRARDYEASLSVDHPDVIKAAKQNGVSPDEVMVARARVEVVRAEIRDAAARVQSDEFDRLYQWNTNKIKGPGSYKGSPPAEYDFLETLDAREKARLSRKWFDSSTNTTPDVLGQIMQTNDASLSGMQLDDVMREWLDVNRRYEMSGAVRRGRLPSDRAYSGALDVDDLLSEISDQGISVRRVLSSDDLDVAGHIASADRVAIADDAYQYLGKAANPEHGSSPYRMSFQRWEEEVRDLEYGLRNVPSEMPRNARARLAELVPEYIDEAGLDYEELYSRIVTTARTAGEEVPSHARIPWQ